MRGLTWLDELHAAAFVDGDTARLLEVIKDAATALALDGAAARERLLPAEVDSIVPDPDADFVPQRLQDLRRLEQLTWDAAVRAHVSLRSPVARKRMQAHPAHLSGAIENWFAQPAIQPNAWDTSDAKDHQARRQLLAFELGDGTEYGARYRAERLLRALHPSRLDAVAGELFNSLHPDDPARGALVALMDRTGSVPTVAAEAVQTHRAAVAASTPAEPAHERPPWRPEPMPVDPIVTKFDGMGQDLGAIVTLALEIVVGDVHEIYGTPARSALSTTNRSISTGTRPIRTRTLSERWSAPSLGRSSGIRDPGATYTGCWPIHLSRCGSRRSSDALRAASPTKSSRSRSKRSSSMRVTTTRACPVSGKGSGWRRTAAVARGPST